MSVKDVKEVIEQGREVYATLDGAAIQADWQALGVEAVKKQLYDAIVASNELQAKLAAMILPLQAYHESAKKAQVLFNDACDGTNDWDMFDLMASADVTTGSSLELGVAVVAMEAEAANVDKILVAGILALGQLTYIYEKVNENELPDTIAATPAQVVECADKYLHEH